MCGRVGEEGTGEGKALPPLLQSTRDATHSLLVLPQCSDALAEDVQRHVDAPRLLHNLATPLCLTGALGPSQVYNGHPVYVHTYACTERRQGVALTVHCIPAAMQRVTYGATPHNQVQIHSPFTLYPYCVYTCGHYCIVQYMLHTL